MNRWLSDILEGREDNYMLPFYWQHGDHYDRIPEQIERIRRSGCRALCVESRPHPDFCGETWWRDMDLILREAEKRGMKVWILDDDHFPTGHAAGAVEKHPELRRWQLVERHVDVMGPLKDALLTAEETGEDHVLAGIYAYPRTGEGEACRPEPLCFTDCVTDGFLRFSVPKGCWRVFFLYRSRRGNTKKDYIDMLREESVKLLIDAVYEPHYRHYARYFGNTVAGFFSDEPTLGADWYGRHATDMGMYDHRVGMPGLAMPWNDRIPGMMEKTLGKDPLALLPALWFDFGEDTGRIRHAYMDAVTRLYRDCFTRQLGDWCEAHGVEYIGHIIEDMNAHARLGCSGGHYFRSLDGQHMSGIDIVLHQLLPGMSGYIHTASAFGNNADPEFFDYVLAKLASSFAHVGTQMKGRAMCEVFGAYGWAEGTPCMKWLLDHLIVRGVNRFVPHAFSSFFPDPDCPPHFGAEGKDPQFDGFSALMEYGNRAVHLLSGGRYIADAAVLYHADAEWSAVHGEYQLTQIPAKILYDEHIDFDILPADCFTKSSGSRVFPASAEDGKLRVGEARYQCLIVPAAESLPGELEEAFERLTVQGVPVIRMETGWTKEDLMARVDAAVTRDVLVSGGHPFLRAAHYAYEDGSDVCMFVNESVTDPVTAEIAVKGAGDCPQAVVLDLLNDRLYRVPCGKGRISLSLAPYQSVFVIFDRDAKAWKDLPERTKAVMKKADLRFRIEEAPYTDLEGYVPAAEGIPAEEHLPDPGFSGRIRYSCRFEKPEGVTGIDLGTVGQNVRLFCNGKDLGIRICPPYSFDLSSALREGENELTAVVSNTLANAVRDGFSSFMAIPASGIRGPVRWILSGKGKEA